jgi:N-acylneuraminate cytidylyltransferase/CMP-N,N'-diacetyllegionaminic acid synthase
MNRLCTICARGGSKGIPNKNLRVLAGQPLIAHTVRQAKNSGLFTHIAVSSDSNRILEVAEAAGADIMVVRPPALASDFADKSPAIVHCGKEVERRTGQRFETFVDLDATAPLRRTADIRGAVLLLESSGASNVYSVCRSRRSPYYNMVELDTQNVPRLVKRVSPPPLRRQDTPVTYDMNASIYAWTRDIYMNHGAPIHTENSRVYVMSEETVYDIDTETDLEIVSMLISRNERELNL